MTGLARCQSPSVTSLKLWAEMENPGAVKWMSPRNI